MASEKSVQMRKKAAEENTAMMLQKIYDAVMHLQGLVEELSFLVEDITAKTPQKPRQIKK